MILVPSTNRPDAPGGASSVGGSFVLYCWALAPTHLPSVWLGLARTHVKESATLVHAALARVVTHANRFARKGSRPILPFPEARPLPRLPLPPVLPLRGSVCRRKSLNRSRAWLQQSGHRGANRHNLVNGIIQRPTRLKKHAYFQL